MLYTPTSSALQSSMTDFLTPAEVEDDSIYPTIPPTFRVPFTCPLTVQFLIVASVALPAKIPVFVVPSIVLPSVSISKFSTDDPAPR